MARRGSARVVARHISLHRIFILTLIFGGMVLWLVAIVNVMARAL